MVEDRDKLVEATIALRIKEEIEKLRSASLGGACGGSTMSRLVGMQPPVG
jgi:hypothetical protein